MNKPERTVLILIDVQEGFNEPTWGVRNNPFFEKNTSRLLDFWREQNKPVIHVQHLSIKEDSPLRPDQPGSRLMRFAQRERLMHEQALWHKQYPAMPPQAWPSITYETSIGLHLDGEDIELVQLPHGHTDGDTVVYFKKNKVVSMGDLYFDKQLIKISPE